APALEVALTPVCPKSASSPRPKPRFLTAMPVLSFTKRVDCSTGRLTGCLARAPYQLPGQSQIGHGTAGLLVVGQHRQPVAGCLGQTHVARDDRLVQSVPEMLAQLLGHFPGQAVARIIH